MPYKLREGAIEQAKYRAKLAVREAAHPAKHSSRNVQWRWASALAVAAVVVVGVIGFVKHYDDVVKPMSPMEELIAEMKSAPDDVIYDWSADMNYYVEDVSSL